MFLKTNPAISRPFGPQVLSKMTRWLQTLGTMFTSPAPKDVFVRVLSLTVQPIHSPSHGEEESDGKQGGKFP